MAENENPQPAGEPSWQFQPGQTVTPGTSAPSTEQSAPPAPAEPVPPTEPSAPPSQPAEAATSQAPDEITWTASEFVAHQKSPSWYIRLALVAIIVAVLVWLLTRDKISAAVVLVGAAALGGYGARQPRELQYRLDTSGLTIEQRHYSYEQFRSFAIIPEGAFSSIVFVPLKRFAPLTTIYYAPEDEDGIVTLLSACLPLEERQHDMVDRLMNRIRF